MTRKTRSSPAPWPAYARLPPFVPVPVRARRDGWTALRQAEFIGWLAQTGCVREAAARVGCSRETAYRLRRRAGAESFAHAWDAVLAIRGGNEIPARKVTPEELWRQAMDGAFILRMRRGRFAGVLRRPSSSALLRLLSGYRRARGGRVR